MLSATRSAGWSRSDAPGALNVAQELQALTQGADSAHAQTRVASARVRVLRELRNPNAARD